MTSRLKLLTIFLFTFNLQNVLAQDLDTVTIAGRIMDQNGAILPGAEIQAKLIKTGLTRTTTSDVEGRYRLIQLEPGTYVVRISIAGFASQEMTGLATVSGQSLQLDTTLIPADVVVDPVVITDAEAPIVDTKRTVAGATLAVRDTELLPIATRSVLDLLFTLPGITEEPLSTRDLAEDRNVNHANTPEEAGTFSLAGAPAYSNNLTIDGLDNNDDRAARERFQPSMEAVAEVQVITNQFSAEYGRASGGRVNLRTRSGSKEFHASAFYFFRDEALNANTFRNNSLGISRLPLQEHVAGFTLGGPMKGFKDTVFFASYELNKVLDSSLIDTLVPVKQSSVFKLPTPTAFERARLEDAEAPMLATEIAPFIAPINTPIKNTSITARVDHQFSSMHNGAFVYQAGRFINLRQSGGGNRLAEAFQGRRRDSDAISYSDTLVLSERMVNQTRFQFSRLAPAFETSAADTPVVLITLNDPLLVGDPERRTGTLVAGSSTAGGSDRHEERRQLQDVLSFVTGAHSLKFGVDVHQVRSTFIDLSDISGTYNFSSAGDFLAGIPSRFRQNFQSSSTQKNLYTGIFVQDDWQIAPKLLVSYGLRYEYETILRDKNNFGPRFSLAYSPLESGKLVLRLGGGIFFNRPLLRTIDDFALGKQQLFFDTNLLRDQSTGKLMSADQRRVFIAEHLRFPEKLSGDSRVVRDFGVLNTNFSRRLDPALRIPESYQLNAGIERDLGRGYSVEANFSYTRGIHLWREFNVNAPVLPAGYRNFSEFLVSRDFVNFTNPATSTRLLYNAATAGELVRFVYGNSNAVNRVIEFGVPVSVMNLNNPSSTTMLEVALAAINNLRPDPARGELEQLISAGNSFYRGMTLELRKRFGSGFTFRAGYTLSSLIDDGVVNTSDAVVPGDFRAERARSLLDRRHRFVFSGTFDLRVLQLSPIWRVASGAPFNISLGGMDRNLDDVSNDRPNYSGDLRLLRWRKSNESIQGFSVPPIGQVGNLPRNAGRGPGLFVLDLSVTREVQIGGLRIRPSVEFDNVLNKTVFSFGSEFIDSSDFLVPKRTMRPRQIRIGIKISHG
ncbi:MAG TPA: carboxypeptidase regulatory-like domain-containing protein [Pyrinomonadaceae bacterium]|nr:carboxypeptidase regulatory-like domain-containing protein [Pyrinomonadaceae bacterium]